MKEQLEQLINNGASIDIDYYLEKINNYNNKEELIQEIHDYITSFDETNPYELRNISVALTNPYIEFYHNYKDKTIYDLASITKLFTLKAIYTLYKEDKIDLNKNVKDYLPNLNNFDNYTVLDAIKMLGKIETNGKLSDAKTNEEFNNILNTVEVKSKNPDDSCYTDIGHIILGKIIESLTNKTISDYYKEVIFNKYEMNNTMFLPTKEYTLLGNGNKNYLPHDFKTRTSNGQTGAAGTFSDIKDLTKLNKSIYNMEFFDEDFIKQIFDYQFIDFRNRVRSYSGLYRYTVDNPCYIPKQFSKYTLGHQGFTGALIVSDLKFHLTQTMLFDAIKDGEKLKHPDFLKGFYEFQEKINEYSILLYIITKKEHI